MTSPMEELFRVALGLAEPWQVTKITFSEEQQRLDLWLDFPVGSRFPCPACAEGAGVYDTAERTWRHLNFFQHQTYLHARQPRISCPEDGVKTVEVPWARPGTGFTLLMEAFVLLLAQGGMTPRQIGRVLREHDTRIWRILQHYVQEAEPLLKRWYFWATHSRIGPIIKAAKTVKKHWDGVLRWFTSRITNGVLEAINSLIQSAKAKARGFRSTEYLITMVYLIAGKLNFRLPALAATHTK